MGLFELVNIRQVKVEDVNFILSSSYRSLLSVRTSIFKCWREKNIGDYLEKMIIASINNLDYSILIACHKDDTDHILGYIVADTNKNHILLQYTKFNFRGLGLQAMLMPLVIDKEKTITVQFCSSEMKKLANAGKIEIKNVFQESLIEALEKEKAIENRAS